MRIQRSFCTLVLTLSWFSIFANQTDIINSPEVAQNNLIHKKVSSIEYKLDPGLTSLAKFHLSIDSHGFVLLDILQTRLMQGLKLCRGEYRMTLPSDSLRLLKKLIDSFEFLIVDTTLRSSSFTDLPNSTITISYTNGER